jgi:CelD/BcsL family acetyltransferase involved in cellulose biosynthesis
VSDVVVEEESAERVRLEWDQLAERLGAPPFRFSGWTLTWQAAFGSGPLRVLVAREQGRLVAVLPVTARHGFVRSPTNWHTPEFGVLAESTRARDAVLDAALTLARRQLRIELLDQETATTLRSLAASRGRRSESRVVLNSPYLCIEGEFADYFASRSRNTRKLLNRRIRQLNEVGALDLEVHRSAGQAVLEDFFRLEGSGWKVTEGTALRRRRGEEAFYRAVAAWGEERGWLRLAFLCVGGRRVATDLGLEARGVRYVLKTGYDVDFGRFSPGMVLRHHDIADAFAAGLRSYEFLGAEDDWKKPWTGTARPRVRAYAFGGGPLGILGYLAQTRGRATVRRLRQLPQVSRSRRGRTAP